MRRLLVLVAVAALAVALPSAVRANEPLRSGTITGWAYTGWEQTWPATFAGEGRNCQWDEWEYEGVRGANPECRIWLDSHCDPDLAGRDPAVTASIQDVSRLADGTTTRIFEWEAPREAERGGVVVQLWKGDCTEIEGSEWRSVHRHESCCSWKWINEESHAFVLPRAATWMTVTTNDTVRVQWALR